MVMKFLHKHDKKKHLQLSYNDNELIVTLN
jgi:hypothetical protein